MADGKKSYERPSGVSIGWANWLPCMSREISSAMAEVEQRQSSTDQRQTIYWWNSGRHTIMGEVGIWWSRGRSEAWAKAMLKHGE